MKLAEKNVYTGPQEAFVDKERIRFDIVPNETCGTVYALSSSLMEVDQFISTFQETTCR